MKSVFDTAVQSGLNLWDTAAVYGMGDSEKALGKLIRGYPREDLILSTKFTPNIADEQAAHPVSAMLEESLGRLVLIISIFTGYTAPRMLKNGPQALSPYCRTVK